MQALWRSAPRFPATRRRRSRGAQAIELCQEGCWQELQVRDAPQLSPDEILVGLEPLLRQHTGRTRDIRTSTCAPLGARAHAAGAPAEQPLIPHWRKSRARRTDATSPVRRTPTRPRARRASRKRYAPLNMSVSASRPGGGPGGGRASAANRTRRWHSALASAQSLQPAVSPPQPRSCTREQQPCRTHKAAASAAVASLKRPGKVRQNSLASCILRDAGYRGSRFRWRARVPRGARTLGRTHYCAARAGDGPQRKASASCARTLFPPSRKSKSRSSRLGRSARFLVDSTRSIHAWTCRGGAAARARVFSDVRLRRCLERHYRRPELVYQIVVVA